MGGRGDVPSCHKVNVSVTLKFPCWQSVRCIRRQGVCVEPVPRTTNELGVISPTHLHLPSQAERFKPVRIRTFFFFPVPGFPTGWSEWRRSGQIGSPYQPIQGLRFGFLRVGDEPSVFPRTPRQQFHFDRDSGGCAVRNSTWGRRHGRANVPATSDASTPLRNFSPAP